MEVTDSVIIRGQQDFEKFDQLNPVEIQIDGDRIIYFLKNIYKKRHIDLYQLAY